MTLPPFGADAKCPKCGHDKIVTQYHGPDSCRWDAYCPGRGGPEHLKRKCIQCFYTWAKETLDSQKTGEKP